jgi:hypothetical protein
MAYDIRLTDDWDLAPSMTLTDDAARVAQQIKITLGFWLGEWFLDTSQGVPYLERILVKNPNMAHVRQTVLEKILSVDGVKAARIDSIFFDRQRRNAEIIYTAETDSGTVTEEVSLSVRS